MNTRTPALQIEEYLTQHNVGYKKYVHAPCRFAADAIAVFGPQGETEGVKTILFERDGQEYGLLALPALGVCPKNIRTAVSLLTTRVVSGREWDKLLPQVPRGGVGPFGGLYHLPVFCDERLLAYEQILVGAGDCSVTLRLSMKDFLECEQPTLVTCL